MRHDEAREAISAAADGELDDDALLTQVEDHLADCAECAAFEATIRHVRSELRFERLDDIPDLPMPELPDLVVSAADDNGEVDDEVEVPDDEVPETTGASESTVRSLTSARSARSVRRARDSARRGRPLWVAAVAAAIVGLIAGVGFAGLGNESTPPAAADRFGELILQAQHDIQQVDADFTIDEFGGDTGERRFAGSLLYEAPESLRLAVTEAGTADTSATTATAPGNVDLAVEDGTWTLDSVRTCESCPGGMEPWRQRVDGREPFSEAAPIPLELITAVDGFALAEEPIDLGARTIAGHQALGVRVTAAQISGFLTGLSPARDLRATHPTDTVDIWFDRDYLVPMAVDVRAADSTERDEWARIKGYDDEPGDDVLSYVVGSIAINGENGSPEPTREAPAPSQVQITSEGFRAGDPAFVPEPRSLAAGLRPHLTGTVSTAGGPTVGVRTWTDGRAWVKVRASEEWSGNRLFGDLGDAAFAVDLGKAGTAYVDSDGGKVALHTDGLDVVVSGSLSTQQLRKIAGSLGVVGTPIPDTWSEAATATLDQAAGVAPDLLVAAELGGFAAPGVRISDGLVVQVYTGPGERAFVLTRSDESSLSPPAGAKNLGVEVRGQPGRYGFDRGELEWTESGATYSLSSSTLSLAELVAIADGLAPL